MCSLKGAPPNAILLRESNEQRKKLYVYNDSLVTFGTVKKIKLLRENEGKKG